MEIWNTGNQWSWRALWKKSTYTLYYCSYLWPLWKKGTTMILYENMKPIEHVLLQPICVLSHLVCACKHCNVKSSLYYWTQWSCWWAHHFKKHRYHAIVHNNRDTQVDSKNRSGWKKTLSGSPGNMRQNAYSHNLKWTFEDLLPCYCYAIKTRSTTIG